MFRECIYLKGEDLLIPRRIVGSGAKPSGTPVTDIRSFIALFDYIFIFGFDRGFSSAVPLSPRTPQWEGILINFVRILFWYPLNLCDIKWPSTVARALKLQGPLVEDHTIKGVDFHYGNASSLHNVPACATIHDAHVRYPNFDIATTFLLITYQQYIFP